MKEVTAFKFTYIPWNRAYPIKYVDVHIVAETRKEAEMIALDSWKFFNQDCDCVVTEEMQGYQKT